jgi:hypothetical protein
MVAEVPAPCHSLPKSDGNRTGPSDGIRTRTHDAHDGHSDVRHRRTGPACVSVLLIMSHVHRVARATPPSFGPDTSVTTTSRRASHSPNRVRASA